MGFLTQSEYDTMFEAQGGRCAICRKRSLKRKLDADHDHSILREKGIVVVRGLLCRRDNRHVGGFEYSDEALTNAIKYLQMIKKLRRRHGVE